MKYRASQVLASKLLTMVPPTKFLAFVLALETITERNTQGARIVWASEKMSYLFRWMLYRIYFALYTLGFQILPMPFIQEE